MPLFSPMQVVGFLFSYSTHQMSAQAFEAGENQGLSPHGGRIYQEPGETETTGRET